ncbi:uncharacterized protein BO96DRAFT_195662 [Aspergillus niger CBS 101883]|uniref:uncharacterized protein n=1 Tax=Aspergillus lacticoffeatus (strain CBS 101883) TaxID=1450533 RepID=UPI000D7F0255|nr:uncharacterized protein BO96DRAFT_195662 [Aspergillus niger CBS 101883]PYH51195.1 hypothetical protein BO96DRAFT_195662 [Aspergillus niger CBS 101883]
MIRASAPPITRSYRFIRNFSPHFILLYLLCSLLSSILFYSTLLYLLPSPSYHPLSPHLPATIHSDQFAHFPYIQTPSPSQHHPQTLLSTSIKTGSLPKFQPHQNHPLTSTGSELSDTPRRPLPTTTTTILLCNSRRGGGREIQHQVNSNSIHPDSPRLYAYDSHLHCHYISDRRNERK